MKGSRLVCALHASLLGLLILAAAGSIAIQRQYPVFFSAVFIKVYTLGILATIANWPVPGGCILTRWERQLLEREKRAAYQETFILHYLQAAGIQLPKGMITSALLSIMLVPFVVWFLG